MSTLVWRAVRAALPAAATAAAALGLVAPRAASAQGFVSSVMVHAEAGGGQFMCDQRDATSASKSCGAAGVQGTAMARIDADNALHAGAWLSRTGTAPVTTYRSTATATFADLIDFTKAGVLAPTQIALTITLHGNIRGSVASVDALGYLRGSEPDWALSLDDPGETQVTDRLRTGTFIVPVVNGVARFSLSLMSDVHMNVPDNAGVCNDAECWSDVYADGWNTLRIDEIVARDARGGVVNGLQATSASGVAYNLRGGAIASTTAPEPATLALLGAGALPLGLFARRRARARA